MLFQSQVGKQGLQDVDSPSEDMPGVRPVPLPNPLGDEHG